MESKNRKSHSRTGIWATIVSTILTGCGGAVLPETHNEQEQPVERAACAAPEGLVLTDIESVTDWINALPKPLDLPCFIQSLPRPLNVNLTESIFSAQRSNGRGNPRVFIFIDRLVLSVVPQELTPKGAADPKPNLLELSYRTTDINSIKAELVFPLQQTIAYSEPYVRTNHNFAPSVCGVCHGPETIALEFEEVSAYDSRMLRPLSGYEVPIELLKNENRFCDPSSEAHRCAMLDALIGEGDIYWRDFETNIPQF